jgi:hypothetical protein
MPLITAADLASWLGVDPSSPRLDAAISVAHDLAAAYVGTDSLEAMDRIETITPPRDRNTLELRYGPLTELISVMIAGDPVGDIEAGAWIIGRRNGFRAGVVHTVAYRTGWDPDDSGAGAPSQVRSALLMIASAVHARGIDGGTKTSERIGDWAATFSVDSGIVPDDARLLLRHYRRPQL